MKKIVFMFMLVFSSLIFGDYLEDRMESQLMRSYPRLTDGNVNLPVMKYDVDIKKDRIKVEIKVDKYNGRRLYNELEKDKLEKEFIKISNEIRKELRVDLPVRVTLELEKGSSSSDKLFNGYY